ncbi:MAG: hypothetical protein Q8M96_04455, partial [Rubrivivax sp.]|nr:hypothetical protein [Rubrivivax sp.]
MADAKIERGTQPAITALAYWNRIASKGIASRAWPAWAGVACGLVASWGLVLPNRVKVAVLPRHIESKKAVIGGAGWRQVS